MKRIEAIIRPHKQATVLAGLAKLGLTNVTVIKIMGLARQASFSSTYKAINPDTETQTGLIPKLMLLLFVADDQVPPILELIRAQAFTGDPGDGAIAVSQVEQIIRIRPKPTPVQAKRPKS
jgi:nitrogen regulatory protein PII